MPKNIYIYYLQLILSQVEGLYRTKGNSSLLVYYSYLRLFYLFLSYPYLCSTHTFLYLKKKNKQKVHKIDVLKIQILHTRCKKHNVRCS